jgi:hypothetical protein
VHPDRDWSAYRRLLYPSAEDYRRIRERQRASPDVSSAALH